MDFRVIVQLGCVCSVDRQAARKMKEVTDNFELNQLNFRNITQDFPYMDLSVVKYLFLYQHKCGNKNFIGLFFPAHSKAAIFVIDTVRSDQMPANITTLFNQHRNERWVQSMRFLLVV
jgi:DNA polymerase epsilon subunit 1